MLIKLLTRLFGTKNDRVIKRLSLVVEQINALEETYKALDDEALQALTPSFKERYVQGESLDDLMPEAFAAVREASRRILEMRHYDSQLIGGMALHSGMIAEMKTGEGKTLVATLPAYLNALTGKGVHVVTVNDYLASRDAEWMGKLYNFMGLTVGNIIHGLDDDQRKAAYNADITYGTNNEFGFDYLRDNMKFSREQLVQRDLNFAIVDEVDSILIDEARTPLIISGPAEQSTQLYGLVDSIMPFFKEEADFTVDEKSRSVTLTDEGVQKAETKLNVENLFDPSNIEVLHHVNQGLKAHYAFKRDTDYIVKDGKVVIVDEFTGRLMEGRRYSEGLHQALEAKEKVRIENENQTLASITFQNYFRMYDTLCGMTGTAMTEAEEFMKIYGLDCLVIPTNKPMIRNDRPDVIYKTRKEKFDAVAEEIINVHKTGQPVLVGTISIDMSEQLSKKLSKKGVKHEVLNAKHHGKEAEIVAMAGQKGAVTLSTNMAGRGTDIVLGEGVTELGGLYILGTERHDSRRIDNQLRGRSGRQGDPGISRYFLSLEDDLLRIFGGERITAIMERLGLEDGEPIEHRLISRAIENAQRKVEGHNFDIRKHILEYDDVMNKQREVIYRQRREALRGGDLHDEVLRMVEGIAWNISSQVAVEKALPASWDWESFNQLMGSHFNTTLTVDSSGNDLTRDTLSELVNEHVLAIMNGKEALIGSEQFRQLERYVILQTVDNHWKDHLLSMDHLKEGVGLRGYAQQNPLIVYKKEGFEMFQAMIERIQEEVVAILFRIQIAEPEQVEEVNPDRNQSDLSYSHNEGGATKQPARKADSKVGRNDPCSCGSGKKYKKCCGQA
ncbi:protein translocase subunit SecA [Desulfoluna limicola]|uniref:Protein translocase subunit SecA n=1 Tax=Desulfoluna limicola TaxID=2810562 RepID=A0ABM7PFI9_9BACT|nr:preprotein translocase subunit SecA [Desulfoluna limicola]BCS95950.1 protein translocase subunit SecA [Desulfoluna limicola]